MYKFNVHLASAVKSCRTVVVYLVVLIFWKVQEICQYEETRKIFQKMADRNVGVVEKR